MEQINLGKISEYWERMQQNIEGAVRLSGQLSNQQQGDLVDALQWGLVKYVENATESAKQLDNLSHKTLFKALTEIPLDGDSEDLNWRNLIKMRDVVAHSFWKVDHDLVKRSVDQDFAALLPFIQTVRINPTPVSLLSKGSIVLTPIDSSELLELPPSEPDAAPRLGAALIFLFLDTQRGFGAMRFGRNSNNQLLLAGSPDWLLEHKFDITIQTMKNS